MADPNPSVSQTEELRDADMDGAVEADLNLEATQPDNTDVDGAKSQPSSSTVADITQATEPRIPAKKDANLREFLSKMDDYAPIVCTPHLFFTEGRS